MHEAVDDVIQRRRIDPGGLNRFMAWSLGIHLGGALLVAVVPGSWFTHAKEEPLIMTISLGGSPGEKSGGLVPVGGKTVEEVAPPPKRPQPIKSAPPQKAPAVTVAAKPTPKPTPKPVEAKEPGNVTRPPSTGAQISRGSTVADTGTTGQSTGTASGGNLGGAQAQTDADFCCKEYLAEIERRINAKWKRFQPDVGSNTVVFEISKDGSFTKPEWEKKSESVMLNIATQDAFTGVTFPPLPPQYDGDKLRIHLTFPYVR